MIAKFISKYFHYDLPKITAKQVGDVTFECAFDMMYECRENILRTDRKFDCMWVFCLFLILVWFLYTLFQNN